MDSFTPNMPHLRTALAHIKEMHGQHFADSMDIAAQMTIIAAVLPTIKTRQGLLDAADAILSSLQWWLHGACRRNFPDISKEEIVAEFQALSHAGLADGMDRSHD